VAHAGDRHRAGTPGPRAWLSRDAAGVGQPALSSTAEGLDGHQCTALGAPDSRSLIAADDTNSILRLDLTQLADVRAHAEQSACSRTTGGLTKNDWTAADIEVTDYRDTCPAG